MTEARAPFDIEISKSALRSLAKIARNDQLAIRDAITQLRNDPYPPGNQKLKGGEGERRIRVGNYRVIYEVDHGRVRVLVLTIGHRRDVYRS